MTRALIALLAPLLVVGAAWACDDAKIDDAWVREAPPGANVMAGYMRIYNSGEKTLEINRVTSPSFGHVMLHETRIVDGAASMRHLDSLKIPAKGTASLEPNGKHLMLHGPQQPLREGDHVDITLHCGNTRRVISVPVKRATP